MPSRILNIPGQRRVSNPRKWSCWSHQPTWNLRYHRLDVYAQDHQVPDICRFLIFNIFFCDSVSFHPPIFFPFLLTSLCLEHLQTAWNGIWHRPSHFRILPLTIAMAHHQGWCDRFIKVRLKWLAWSIRNLLTFSMFNFPSLLFIPHVTHTLLCWWNTTRAHAAYCPIPSNYHRSYALGKLINFANDSARVRFILYLATIYPNLHSFLVLPLSCLCYTLHSIDYLITNPIFVIAHLEGTKDLGPGYCRP